MFTLVMLVIIMFLISFLLDDFKFPNYDKTTWKSSVKEQIIITQSVMMNVVLMAGERLLPQELSKSIVWCKNYGMLKIKWKTKMISKTKFKQSITKTVLSPIQKPKIEIRKTKWHLICYEAWKSNNLFSYEVMANSMFSQESI